MTNRRSSQGPASDDERRALAREANARWRESHPEAWAVLQARNNDRRRERRAGWTPEQRASDNERQRQAYAERHQDRARAYAREKLYGLTADALAAMRSAQGDACPICLEPFVKEPHVDHDHATGRIRGLLCGRCNLGLGKFRDDPERLRRAVDYLQ